MVFFGSTATAFRFPAPPSAGMLCVLVLLAFHAAQVAASTPEYTEECPTDCQLESFFPPGTTPYGPRQGLASQCYKDVEDGGCCTADGEYSSDSFCDPCHVLDLGNPARPVCQDCFKPTSPCKHINYVIKAEPTCEETACRGGCLRSGVCDYFMNESTCRKQGGGAIFCQSCPLDTWYYCAWTSFCFGQCNHGCCASGTDMNTDFCPEEPYEMQTSDRQCGYCASVPDYCHSCWAQSVCSYSYNSTRPGPALESIGPMMKVPTKNPTPEPTPAPSTDSPTIALPAEDEYNEASSTSRRVPTRRLTTATMAIASVLGLGGAGCMSTNN